MEISNVHSHPLEEHETKESREKEVEVSRKSCTCRSMFDVSVLRRML